MKKLLVFAMVAGGAYIAYKAFDKLVIDNPGWDVGGFGDEYDYNCSPFADPLTF